MAKNKKGRDINGIVLLDKDTNISSNKALQQVKKLFFAKKAGHTGSLDPLASGILPICLGQSTKIAQFLLNDNKSYFVSAKLGFTSNTLDSEGDIKPQGSTAKLSAEKIKKTVQSFKGEIKQMPPMYSALKKDGKPLYKLARAGIEVERKLRQISIYKIDRLSYENDILSFEVSCSKGTYIRTLIDDIGQKLGCGAYVIKLRRIGFADTTIKQSIKFNTLKDMQTTDYKKLDKILIPSEDMLPNLDSVFLSEIQTKDIKFGRKIQLSNTILEQKTNKSCLLANVKLFDENEDFFGIGIKNKNIVTPKRLFV